MSNNSIRAVFEPLRDLPYTSITGSSYVGIGAPLANPSHIFMLQNLTDVTLRFSFDGINDHVVLPADSFFLPDITANRTSTGGALFFAQGTRFYVRAPDSDPTMGQVAVTTVYGFQND